MKEKLIAAEIAFEEVYHKYAEDTSEEAALTEASKVYTKICGKTPNLDNFGFEGWFDPTTKAEIETGVFREN